VGEEGDVERARPAVHRDPVAAADVLREPLLELRDPRPLGKLPALQDLEDGPLLLLAERRLRDRNQRAAGCEDRGLNLGATQSTDKAFG